MKMEQKEIIVALKRISAISEERQKAVRVDHRDDYAFASIAGLSAIILESMEYASVPVTETKETPYE